MRLSEGDEVCGQTHTHIPHNSFWHADRKCVVMHMRRYPRSDWLTGSLFVCLFGWLGCFVCLFALFLVLVCLGFFFLGGGGGGWFWLHTYTDTKRHVLAG